MATRPRGVDTGIGSQTPPQSARDRYASPAYARFLAQQNAATGQNTPYTANAVQGWWQGLSQPRTNYAAQARAAAAPSGGASRGGGSRGGGGGGGGSAGATAAQQAMFDQAIALLGRGAAGPQLQQYAAFQGQDINPFQDAMFQQLQAQLGQAVQTDTANVNQINQQTLGQLQQNYQNPYQQMLGQGVAAPAPSQEGAGLVAPGALQAGADQQQIENQNSQGAFQSLLGVLAGANQQSQASRVHQLGLDRQTALNQIGAQNTGLGAQIGVSRNQAYEDWLRRDEERRYQNSIAAQEVQRQNADIANQQSVAGVAQRNQVLQPLLDLIASGGGGLNMNTLQQLIASMQ